MVDIDYDILTEVRYNPIQGVYLPSALCRYHNVLDYTGVCTPDGIITLNPNTVWDYNIGENITADGKNLAYGIMRSIGRIMGFGSSVSIDQNDNYAFGCRRAHSIFDKLVVNSTGKPLSSISIKNGRPNAELKDYANASGDSFYVKTANSSYRLSSPPYTPAFPPFTFIDDVNSLMRGDLQIGSYAFQVDGTTSSILNELGWNTKSAPSITIVSDDVSGNGLASAYESHTFRIQHEASSSITNPRWIFELPLANGSTQAIQLTDNNLSCITPQITDESPYKINADGDIKCKLQFSCDIDGHNVKAVPFTVFLELKPVIEYALIENIIYTSSYAYDAYYKVKYRGSDFINVSIEEEYGSAIRTESIKEPYIANGVARQIKSSYYTWIDFTTQNKYGKSIYTIEIQPDGIVTLGDPYKSASISKDIHETDGFYEIYDIHGNKIGESSDFSKMFTINYKGMMFIKHIKDGHIIETLKLMK